MTDNTPASNTAPKRTAAAKTTAAAKSTAANKGSAAPKTTATPKVPATKTPAAKAPATRSPTAKPPATKAPAVKTAKTPARATTASIAPAEVAPADVAASAAAVATAPAGWYPVAPGSPQQRWWDGAQWTEHAYDPRVGAFIVPVPSVQVPVADIAVAQAPVVQAAVVQPSVVQAPVEPLRAPAGTRAGTVWFWLIAVGAPVLQILQLIPASIFIGQVIGGDTDPSGILADSLSPAYLVLALSGWFIYAVCIVFAALDWRELKARGIPKPFHWGWSFFVIALGWPAVYVIGRSVIAKRRTGAGLAPLWVFVGIQIVAFIAVLIIAISATIEFISLLGDGLSTAGNVL